MAFKAVFLDIGGTILEARRPDETYRDILAEHGHAASLEQVSAWLAAAREEAAALRPVRTALFTVSAEQQDRWRRATSEAFLRLAGVSERADACHAAMYASWVGPQIFPLYPDAAPVLWTLKRAGLILGAVSNWEPRLAELLATHGIADMFDFILASEAEGHVKPGARLFQLALERAGVEPHEALHVGDSAREDVEAAEALGIRTVYVQRQVARPLDHAPRLCSLDPLVALATASSLLRGRVERGKGEARGFTQIDWVRRQVEERLGFELSPGTLNVRLTDARDLTAWERLRAEPGVPLEPSPGFCAARCYPVQVEGQVPGAIVFPLVAGYPADIVEVLAPLPLREHFRLAESALITLAVS